MASCMTIFLHTCFFITVHTTIASQTIIQKTYQHSPSNSVPITCNKCLPGYFFRYHCTQPGQNANCTQCQPGTFQPSYNIAKECAPCRSCLSPREMVYRNCTGLRNTECRCQDGHYKKNEGINEGVCLAHKMCPKGQGVDVRGNHVNDTVCVPCKTGFFSPNKSSSEECRRCSLCTGVYEVLEDCTAEADTRCQLKEEEEQGLPGGAIAGIVGGVLLVLIVLGVVVVLCARRGQGPKITQNIYKKYCSGNSKNKKGKKVTNGYTYTPPGAGDDAEKDVSEQQMKLLQVFPNFSRDLIHPEWKFFFRYLFVDSDKYIHEAELNHQGNVREQIHTILKDWVKRDKEKATQERLVSALEQQGRHDLIQKYFSTTTDSDNRMTEV